MALWVLAWMLVLAFVLALGLDTQTVEREGLDRVNISLPGLQDAFAAQVLARGNAQLAALPELCASRRLTRAHAF